MRVYAHLDMKKPPGFIKYIESAHMQGSPDPTFCPFRSSLLRTIL